MWASPKTMALRILLLGVLIAFLLITGLQSPGWAGTLLTTAGAAFGVIALLGALRRDRPRGD